MAGVSSQGWEQMLEEVVEIDGNLLRELLDESQVEEAEDERLGCVVRSLESEIVGGLAETESEYHQNLMVCGLDDPFDWIDLDVAAYSHCDEMGNWYAENYRDEVEMVEFVDAGDCSPFYCEDYSSVENGYCYSPLWQDTYDSI